MHQCICWWEKKGSCSTGTDTWGIQLHCLRKFMSVPMWKEQGCFKPPYQLQQVCQTVTAYWSTDKGCLCGWGLVFPSSVMKISLFFQASLATLKSTTTAPRPHCSLHVTDPKDKEDKLKRFMAFKPASFPYPRKSVIKVYKGGDKVMLWTPPHCFSSFTCQIQLIQVAHRQI